MTQPVYATVLQFARYGLPVAATTRKYTDDEILSFLEGASREADSYIRSQVPLPLISWDLDLTIAVCRIAAITMLDNRGGNAGDPTMYLMAKTAGDRGYDWLSDVSTGKASLNVVTTAPAQASSVGISSRPLRGF